MKSHKDLEVWRASIELAQNYGLSERDLRAINALIKEHEDGIRSAWRQHFGR